MLLENGDELAGTLVGLTELSVEVVVAGTSAGIEMDRVKAVVFNPRLRARRTPGARRIMVGLADGSRLLAESIAVEAAPETEGEQTDKPATVAIRPFDSASWSTPLDRVVWLMPLGRRAVYLSDLEPSGYRHVPFLTLSWPYRVDRNVLGGRLRADGKLYVKGVGMHSASRLTWRLDKPYRRFEADLALDDRVGNSGSVVYRVFVDRAEKYASPVLRGDSPILPISVDISGGKAISLIVDFAERGDELDHADWLNARLVE